MNKEIYFAGGCFWGVEEYFSRIDGVTSTDVGYANGKTENPSYQDVCYNDTGHAEAVHVEYDSDKVDLVFLLNMFYEVIDPTSVNRQGNDRGVQYRSGIYYTDQSDLQTINDSIARLQKNYSEPIAIEVSPLDNYYAAEDYHQDYLKKNPGGYCHIGKDKFEKASNTKAEVQ